MKTQTKTVQQRAFEAQTTDELLSFLKDNIRKANIFALDARRIVIRVLLEREVDLSQIVA
jgi:hypothetical protein